MDKSVSPKSIIVCRCANHELLARQELQNTLRTFDKADNLQVHAVDDLCGMSIQQRDELKALVADDEVEIVACYPRAVKGLFEQAGIEMDWEQTPIHNLRDHSAAEVCAKVGVPATASSAETCPSSESPAWQPWFPVIDLERCNHCRQCLSFCLFDVYALDEDKRVTVENPQNCKDKCPACARVCPEVAIIFPKAPDAPINGAEIQDELLEREKAKITLEQSGGNSLYQTLAARKKRQGGLLKDEFRRKIQEQQSP